jgi:GxxExxY protein
LLQRFLLNNGYISDFIVYEKLIVKIKTVDYLNELEESQLLNYFQAAGMQLGVLINFGSHPNLQWKRLFATPPKYRLPRPTRHFHKN